MPAPQGTTSAAKKHGGQDMLRYELEHSGDGLDFGAATSKSSERTKQHQGKIMTDFRRTIDDSCIGARSHDRPGCIVAGSKALTDRGELEAVIERQRGRDRSDISIRCVPWGIVYGKLVIWASVCTRFPFSTLFLEALMTREITLH